MEHKPAATLTEKPLTSFEQDSVDQKQQSQNLLAFIQLLLRTPANLPAIGQNLALSRQARYLSLEELQSLQTLLQSQTKSVPGNLETARTLGYNVSNLSPTTLQSIRIMVEELDKAETRSQPALFFWIDQESSHRDRAIKELQKGLREIGTPELLIGKWIRPERLISKENTLNSAGRLDLKQLENVVRERLKEDVKQSSSIEFYTDTVQEIDWTTSVQTLLVRMLLTPTIAVEMTQALARTFEEHALIEAQQ